MSGGNCAAASSKSGNRARCAHAPRARAHRMLTAAPSHSRNAPFHATPRAQVDEYYAGLNNTIQHASVRHILESTVESLVRNPSRKFIYVEQAYFQRFFDERTDDEKAVVRELVAEGRLSFVNGAWSMHDEATTSYVDMVDNTCLGHRYIASEFGVAALPSATWQIDPFGHSSLQASLLSSPAAGFNSLFVSRADYADIRARTLNKSLEYIWTSSDSLGEGASTFFSIMNQGLHLYFPLPGLCWDIINCNDPEIQDDPLLDDYNVDDVVRRNIEQAQIQADAYVGDIYYTLGFDFNYEYAEEWFSNVDKLIHYTNLGTGSHGYHMFYSTPQDYARTKLAYPFAWPLKVPSDSDGFPYADGPHSYWTGFLSSRAALKGYVRTTSTTFQALKQIQAAHLPRAELDAAGNELLELQRAVAVTQHHDAVAGTSMQHVANDYAMRLARGLAAAEPVFAAALGPASASCDLANATICPIFEAQLAAKAPTTLTLYNSQAQALAGAPVRIPVALGAGITTYAVTNSSGAAVVAQMLPPSPADAFLRNTYYSWPTGAAQVAWLVFLVDVPQTGFATFTLTPAASASDAPTTFQSVVHTHLGGGGADDCAAPGCRNALGALAITNGDVELTFDNTTNLLASFASSSLGVEATPLTQTWFWWVWRLSFAQRAHPSLRSAACPLLRAQARVPPPWPYDPLPPPPTPPPSPLFSLLLRRPRRPLQVQLKHWRRGGLAGRWRLHHAHEQLDRVCSGLHGRAAHDHHGPRRLGGARGLGLDCADDARLGRAPGLRRRVHGRSRQCQRRQRQGGGDALRRAARDGRDVAQRQQLPGHDHARAQLPPLVERDDPRAHCGKLRACELRHRDDGPRPDQVALGRQ